MGPQIEFPVQWKKGKSIFHIVKHRCMALTFTVNTYRVLIGSFLAAIVPLYSMLCMPHPNSFLLCVPNAKGHIIKVRDNVGMYFLGLLPYVVRLQYGFYVLAKDTWFAYNDQVLATADTFNTWRVLIYLNQVIQLVYSFEGLQSFLQALRTYKLVAGTDNHRVAQLEGNMSKFWYIPSVSTLDVYRASKERAFGPNPH